MAIDPYDPYEIHVEIYMTNTMYFLVFNTDEKIEILLNKGTQVKQVNKFKYAGPVLYRKRIVWRETTESNKNGGCFKFWAMGQKYNEEQQEENMISNNYVKKPKDFGNHASIKKIHQIMVNY